MISRYKEIQKFRGQYTHRGLPLNPFERVVTIRRSSTRDALLFWQESTLVSVVRAVTPLHLWAVE